MAYTLRPFQHSDAQALADLTLAAIRAVGAHRYTAEQVDAWTARHPGPERFLARVEAGHTIFVSADAQDIPVAYALIEPPVEEGAHLDMLYCHPDHTRQGLAGELLAHCEQHARQLGAKRLFTEASELARPAFERAGYKVMHRRDFNIDGPSGSVSIHNYAMEKRLTS